MGEGGGGERVSDCVTLWVVISFICTQERKVKMPIPKEIKPRSIKMLSKEVIEKINKQISSFFGTELASIVLYGSYATGKERQ